MSLFAVTCCYVLLIALVDLVVLGIKAAGVPGGSRSPLFTGALVAHTTSPSFRRAVGGTVEGIRGLCGGGTRVAGECVQSVRQRGQECGGSGEERFCKKRVARFSSPSKCDAPHS